jgi:hypothetical protein
VRQIKLAWVHHSAIPMNLLISGFLDESKAPPVTRQQNPGQAAMFQSLGLQMLMYPGLFFQEYNTMYMHRIQEAISNGKQPSLRNYTSKLLELTCAQCCTQVMGVAHAYVQHCYHNVTLPCRRSRLH